jgi:alpha-N-arabinofuranosidase
MKNKNFFCILLLLLLICSSLSAQNILMDQQWTIVSIPDLTPIGKINPMIYGQMLEDCNDSIVYNGVVDEKGSENKKVSAFVDELMIPVMRWPGGTSIYDYFWEKGIGPLSERKAQKEDIWHGMEYYTFGTDEFLQWCDRHHIKPYINFNMGNNLKDLASLGDAIKWVEYVNGDTISVLGKLRKKNGHEEPYGVKYWCVGNENYLPCSLHVKETASAYADRLERWVSGLKEIYPDLSLLGVGHYADWNDTVLAKCGRSIDFLTEHFYMTSQIKGHQLMNADNTMFSAFLLEENLHCLIAHLKKSNAKLDRTSNPVRLCIDEWNNRHSIYYQGKYSFTRHDARRLYDIPPVASFLNTMIRNSPYVGMANYIFPVNGHGLIKTNGSQDAYKTPLYDLFLLYRKYMTGSALKAIVTGPGVKNIDTRYLSIVGDVDSKIVKKGVSIPYVDAAVSLNCDSILNIALTNRSLIETQQIDLRLPVGFKIFELLNIVGENINESNSVLYNRIYAVKGKVAKKITLPPCGFTLVKCHKLKFRK